MVLMVVMVVVGVNIDGCCEVLGMGVGFLEVEIFWIEFFCKLVWCGLCGVKLVIFDVYEGLKVVVVWVLSVIY